MLFAILLIGLTFFFTNTLPTDGNVPDPPIKAQFAAFGPQDCPLIEEDNPNTFDSKILPPPEALSAKLTCKAV